MAKPIQGQEPPPKPTRTRPSAAPTDECGLEPKLPRSTAMSLRKESMMTVMMAIRTMIEVGDDDNGR